jgi:hypothetical protein
MHWPKICCIRVISPVLSRTPKKQINMNPSSLTPAQPSRSFFRLCVSACALAAALVSLPAFAAEHSAKASDHAAAKLPVSATFSKVKAEDAPPFVLTLKNESKDALEVTVTVLLSVMSHNRDKARHVPPHVIAAGKTWTVGELAALDKVIVEAKGYAPLELEVK